MKLPKASLTGIYQPVAAVHTGRRTFSLAVEHDRDQPQRDL